MDIERLIQELQSGMRSMDGSRTTFFEMAHVTTFKGYRTRKDGHTESVTVEIHDRGSDGGEYRFTCIATSESGKRATGNGGPTIEVAMATTHWQELDEEV